MFCGKDDCVWPDKANQTLAMYVFINKGLGMTSGKVAAQAVQAAVGAYRASKDELAEDWYSLGGHHMTLTMEARDEAHLRAIQSYLDERGFKSVMMIDEGMTEIDAHVLTALAVEIVDKKDLHTAKTFESFKLYRDTIRFNVEIDR